MIAVLVLFEKIYEMEIKVIDNNKVNFAHPTIMFLCILTVLLSK